MSKIIVGLLCVIVSLFIGQGYSLTVTEPDSDTVWHIHSPNEVKWESVSTDPESLEIRIVNNNPTTYPTGHTQTVKDGINTADNKFTIDSLPGLKPGRGYQVNIMSSAGTILAQSAQFSINGTMEKNSTSTATHPNTQSIAQPTLAAPSPSTSASASSDATILGLSSTGKLVVAMALAISTLATGKL
ncbi:hypothetical protein MJO28_014724 [Puccinia striiformis f. sp. tritici]|uniref:Yeast cell wall synthesis Kre9/Knh1-like N-terminal domain-containing protein n=4 Tax=Puccinia striiformis TaxID=27350 RepID=A0A0L0VSN3_9BASI|nr:hypothetical protein Pst134EA_027083 [Puccinia striiformis f. sp. tritici]KAI9625830.1 hypothetical protein H4Q26_016078 [Puccinia striiformis f. sp. tritici PST-130]KNF02298.1 hypothetical protein PSTG_04505 [Puccinia striiformis f. sp. tritici PST-78]POW00730.1 hypothetical protein PSHT_12880 [Puccinia striiformis]KAH9443268.1 hypothetical protein Pst134EB_027616 [Puccinia striiformis f. sp. tritici]KAH9450380.1 hypothetical protein Pst134EA_027083 [Puccinia striiformis f. sp. tritici]